MYFVALFRRFNGDDSFDFWLFDLTKFPGNVSRNYNKHYRGMSINEKPRYL